jgi:hypothetical protein
MLKSQRDNLSMSSKIKRNFASIAMFAFASSHSQDVRCEIKFDLDSTKRECLLRRLVRGIRKLFLASLLFLPFQPSSREAKASPGGTSVGVETRAMVESPRRKSHIRVHMALA